MRTSKPKVEVLLSLRGGSEEAEELVRRQLNVHTNYFTLFTDVWYGKGFSSAVTVSDVLEKQPAVL
jgi:hypothetical protein